MLNGCAVGGENLNEAEIPGFLSPEVLFFMEEERNQGDLLELLDEVVPEKIGEIRTKTLEKIPGFLTEEISFSEADVLAEQSHIEFAENMMVTDSMDAYRKDLFRNSTLLTQEEEEKYGNLIQTNITGVLDLFKAEKENLPMLAALLQRIKKWENPAQYEQGNAKYIGQKHLLFLKSNLEKILHQFPENQDLIRLSANFDLAYTEIREAKDKLINGNLRLVVRIARDYLNRGVPLPDLIQQGNLGLMRAVFCYQPSDNNTFPTYAKWWINQSIKVFVSGGNQIITIKKCFFEFSQKLTRDLPKLEETLGRTATAQDVAEYLSSLTKFKVSLPMAERLLKDLPKTVSLDAPVGDDDSVLGDFIADKSQTSAFLKTHQSELSERIKGVLATLSPKEEKILRLRFGIGEDAEYTLEEIGNRFNVTRERIRQIEAKAMERLRHPSRLKELKGFLD